MSALGHKQTFAPHKGMSPLHPKADVCGANRDVRCGPIAGIAASLSTIYVAKRNSTLIFSALLQTQYFQSAADSTRR
jgi:hypothetical protein